MLYGSTQTQTQTYKVQILINNNNIRNVIPQVESEEDGVYVALPLPCEDRETVPNGPSIQSSNLDPPHIINSLHLILLLHFSKPRKSFFPYHP